MKPELQALLATAAYAAMCGAVWRREHRRVAAREGAAQALLQAADGATPLLILHASQTGQAEALAWQSARLLHQGGLAVRVAPLGDVDPAELALHREVLIVASTYGEGDAPDAASRFAAAMTSPNALRLDTLRFGLLALGDTSFKAYCGFGRQLDTWLRARGANALFERIEADRMDAGAIDRWRRQLAHLAGTHDLAELPGWDAPRFAPWRLLARRQLNQGSQGAPLCHLEFAPQDGELPDWQAGDLVQLRLPDADDDAMPRDYTIASVPSDGRVHLLVRQAGRASSWLCEQLAIGHSADLRVRAHASFRIGANADRPLVLIGNGSGMAGLRAHLRARAGQPHARPCWLVFGERQRAHDALYRDEIDAWQADGLLERVDWTFSRDTLDRRHVQHALREQHARLAAWLDRDAALLVCGSLQGMGSGVDAVLRECLGDARIDALTASGRYLRDVY